MFLVYKINSVINTKRSKKISNNNLNIEYELKEKLVYQHIFMKLMNICDLDINTRSLI